MILSKVVKRAAAMLEQLPPEAPKNTVDVVKMLAEAMRFGYCQTLGAWNLFDLPRAILHALVDKDNKTVGSECGERSDCILLKGTEILKDLYELKKMLTWINNISSKKRFLPFLFAAGFGKEDVLLRKRTARILKPAFTVIRDKRSKCLFVFIRGTRSIKDTLTDAIAAPIPFNHKFIRCDGELRRNNMVSGYAHRGMVTAARWIRKHCTTVLLDALRENPHFKIKIVGHSLGGGTAALLTYMLREMKQFSSCTCVTFGPAASMTMELAEFGRPFITSIINGSDIVPTLSAFSVHDFISKGQIKDRNIITAVGSRILFVKAIAEQAVTSCRLAEACGSSGTSCESLLTEELVPEYMSESSDEDEFDSFGVACNDDDTDEESVCSFPTSVTNLDRHPLYPPGRIMHIVSKPSSENSNSNHSYPNKKHIIYETPTKLYGKLRLKRGMILHHLTNNYLNKLQQVINQLEKGGW